MCENESLPQSQPISNFIDKNSEIFLSCLLEVQRKSQICDWKILYLAIKDSTYLSNPFFSKMDGKYRAVGHVTSQT
jgi:hypothetical protein